MNVPAGPVATFTSRQFNQDTAAAKRVADKGPVIITDRGEPAYVLMSLAEYRRLLSGTQEAATRSNSLRDALVDRAHGDEIELPVPSRRIGKIREVGVD